MIALRDLVRCFVLESMTDRRQSLSVAVFSLNKV